MSTFERALAIAAEAHAGQLGKGDEPYILHPLRVMLQCDSPSERTVAVLHDVVEKTPWTLDRLRDERFPEEIVAAVDALTKREAEDYFDYLRRVVRHPVARRVKIADISDNQARRRTVAGGQLDPEREDRFRRAMAILAPT